MPIPVFVTSAGIPLPAASAVCLDDHFVVYVSDDKTVRQRLHGEHQQITGDRLHDILDESPYTSQIRRRTGSRQSKEMIIRADYK